MAYAETCPEVRLSMAAVPGSSSLHSARELRLGIKPCKPAWCVLQLPRRTSPRACPPPIHPDTTGHLNIPHTGGMRPASGAGAEDWSGSNRSAGLTKVWPKRQTPEGPAGTRAAWRHALPAQARHCQTEGVAGCLKQLAWHSSITLWKKKINFEMAKQMVGSYCSMECTLGLPEA